MAFFGDIFSQRDFPSEEEEICTYGIVLEIAFSGVWITSVDGVEKAIITNSFVVFTSLKRLVF